MPQERVIFTEGKVPKYLSPGQHLTECCAGRSKTGASKFVMSDSVHNRCIQYLPELETQIGD